VGDFLDLIPALEPGNLVTVNQRLSQAQAIAGAPYDWNFDKMTDSEVTI
jgi:hypothetical protein